MFLRVIGKPYLRALVIPYFAILLSAYMADAVVDWSVLRDRLASLSEWREAALVTALIAGWSLIAGKALQPVWRQPFLAFLVRQPLGAWQWVGYLVPSVAVGLLPVAGIAWLAPVHANGLAHYLCLLLLAWPILIGASFRRGDFLRVCGAGTLFCFFGLLASAALPGAVYGVLIIAILAMRLPMAPIARQITSVVYGVYSPLSGSGVIATIVRRDLRYLVRCQVRQIVLHWSVGLVCALGMLAFRINGELTGREALEFACLFYSVSIYVVYEILEALKAGLGKEIMRRRWPVTDNQRALSLLALIACLVGPGAALILAGAATMGPVNALVYLLFFGVTVVGSATLLGRMLIVRRSANGLFLLLLAGHFVALKALPAPIYVLLALVFLPIGFRAVARGFDRFTWITERLSLARLA